MATKARYLLLSQPEELTTTQWNTVQAYLVGASGLGRFASASTQPNEKLHRVVNGTGYLYEGLMEETDLTAAGLAALYSAALGGTPTAATIQGYLGEGTGRPHFQVFALTADWETSRTAAKSHVATFGYVCYGHNDNPPVEYYAATTGLDTNDGSEAAPWSLEYALHGAGGALLPGDIVYLEGVEHTWTEETWMDCSASGYEGQPIIFRTKLTDWIAGNRAVLSGWFKITGNYVRFTDVEFTSPAHERYTEWPGSTGGPTAHGYNWPYDSVQLFGVGVELVSPFIHDKGANGIFYSGNSVGGEGVYGLDGYNNGWDSPDGEMWDAEGNRTPGTDGHGWGMYTQANGGQVKKIRRSVVSSGFNGVWEAQGTGDAQNKNQFLEGNATYGKWLLGWTDEVRDVTVQDHFDLMPGTTNRLGTVATTPKIFNLNVVRGFWWRNRLEMKRWESGSVDGAEFVDPTNSVAILGGDWSDAMVAAIAVDNLVIRNSAAALLNRDGVRTYSLQQSRDLLGWNLNSTQVAGSTTGSRQWVAANEMADATRPDVRRGIVYSINYDSAAVHTLDLSSLALTAGKLYRLRDAFNPFGNAVLDFTSDGADAAVSVDTSAFVMPTPTGTYKGLPVPGPVEDNPPWPNGVGIWFVEYAHDPSGGAFPSVFSPDFSSDFA